jgi:hypothetical protein
LHMPTWRYEILVGSREPRPHPDSIDTAINTVTGRKYNLDVFIFFFLFVLG